MNEGLSTFGVTDDEVTELANWFAVGETTVRRWFLDPPESDGPSPCVPLAAEGRRVFRMYDEGNEGGWGNGSSGPLQNMRHRILMCSTIAVEGGLQRNSPFTGPERSYSAFRSRIDEVIHFVNSVIIGNVRGGYFMSRAWTRIESFVTESNEWEIVVTYRSKEITDRSDDDNNPLDEGDDGNDVEETETYP